MERSSPLKLPFRCSETELQGPPTTTEHCSRRVGRSLQTGGGTAHALSVCNCDCSARPFFNSLSVKRLATSTHVREEKPPRRGSRALPRAEPARDGRRHELLFLTTVVDTRCTTSSRRRRSGDSVAVALENFQGDGTLLKRMLRSCGHCFRGHLRKEEF